MALSTKAIQGRISSVKNTKKITKAMEMVAASKMKRAVDRSLATRRYAELALELLVNLSKDRVLRHPLLRGPENNKRLVLLVASNKGLCGGYNVNIGRALAGYLQDHDGAVVEAVCVGKHAERFAKKQGINVVGSFVELHDQFGVEDIRGIVRLIVDAFEKGEYEQVDIVFTRYISAISNKAVVRGLLPVTADTVGQAIAEMGSDKESHGGAPGDMSLYQFEPTEEEVLDFVLPALTETQVYQALVESSASEHSARMMAMRNASDNADSMVEELTLTFNKARQAGITQEIVEIATGAEATA